MGGGRRKHKSPKVNIRAPSHDATDECSKYPTHLQLALWVSDVLLSLIVTDVPVIRMETSNK